MNPDPFKRAAYTAAAQVAAGMVSRPIRTMRRFAEDEVFVADGPKQGRFRVKNQPFTGLLFDAIDSGRWNRFVVTGPTQSGKTLAAWVIPVLYHLFEIGEKVIISAPKVETLIDKWNEDLKPAIEASRTFRDLLPTKGQGSRDASKALDAVRFRNGAVLKLMGGGGSDKNRAAYTARVVVVTETDGMDEAGGASREADKITQLEHRTDAYGDRKRIYLECTVSIEEGRTWREYQAGTASRIIRPCPKCGAWVTPEREHLEGWREAESAPEAAEKARFACPECSEPWTEEERKAANAKGRLLHRGQEVTPDGEVVGTPARTDTLGFRWSAVDNHFRLAGDAGQAEWKGSRSSDEENAEKELRQFIWAIPYDPPKAAAADLSEQGVMDRQGNLGRWVVPDARKCVTVGVDVGKYRLHFTAVAWLPEGGGRVIGYDAVEVASGSMVEQRAILAALRELRDLCEQGWTTPQGEVVPLSRAWVDAHWNTPTVKEFCAESGAKWFPSVGFGHGQYFGESRTGNYSAPTTKTGPNKLVSPDRYHFKADLVRAWIFDADHWKTELHKRLACVPEDPAALLLHRYPPIEHLSFARHICSEKQVVEFEPGKGETIGWEKKRQANHWLDSTVLALLAGHSAGYARPYEVAPKPAATASPAREESGRRLNMRTRDFKVRGR